MVLHRVVIRTAFAVGAIILGYQSVCTALKLHEEQPESTPFDYAVAIADRHRNAAVAVIETYCPAPLATQCLAVANEIRLTDYSAFLDALARLEVTVAPVVAYGRGLPLSSCTRFGILAIVLAAAYLASLLFQRHCQLFATLVALVLAVTASSRAAPHDLQIVTQLFGNASPPILSSFAAPTPTVDVLPTFAPAQPTTLPVVVADRTSSELVTESYTAVSYSMLDAILEIADSLAPVDQVVTVAALAAPFSGTDFIITTPQYYAVVDVPVISAEMPSAVVHSAAGAATVVEVISVPTVSIPIASDAKSASFVLSLAAATPLPAPCFKPRKSTKTARAARQSAPASKTASAPAIAIKVAPTPTPVPAPVLAVVLPALAPVVAVVEPILPASAPVSIEEVTVAPCVDIDELALIAASPACYSSVPMSGSDSGYESSCNASLADTLSADESFDFSADIIEIEVDVPALPSPVAAPIETSSTLPSTFFTSSWDAALDNSAPVDSEMTIYPAVIRGYWWTGRYINGLPSHAKVHNVPTLAMVMSWESYLGVPAVLHPRSDDDDEHLAPAKRRCVRAEAARRSQKPRSIRGEEERRQAASILKLRRRWEETGVYVSCMMDEEL